MEDKEKFIVIDGMKKVDPEPYLEIEIYWDEEEKEWKTK